MAKKENKKETKAPKKSTSKTAGKKKDAIKKSIQTAPPMQNATADIITRLLAMPHATQGKAQTEPAFLPMCLPKAYGRDFNHDLLRIVIRPDGTMKRQTTVAMNRDSLGQKPALTDLIPLAGANLDDVYLLANSHGKKGIEYDPADIISRARLNKQSCTTLIEIVQEKAPEATA